MGPLNKIQAVTFDVGGTLIEPWPSVGHIYAEVAERNGATGLSPEVLNHRFGVAWSKLKDFNHTRAQWAELVDEVFDGLTARPPSQTFFPELYARFAQPGAWRVFDDVVPTFRALAARGLNLGVISNWDERLRGLLRGLHLAEHLDVVVISCEIGVSKPAPATFAAAAEKLRLQPEAILHVGDSAEADLEGARAAGFRALELRRETGSPGEGQIISLFDLEALLDRSSADDTR
jgi:putative hydrolase of the HAD superfamily